MEGVYNTTGMQMSITALRIRGEQSVQIVVVPLGRGEQGGSGYSLLWQVDERGEQPGKTRCLIIRIQPERLEVLGKSLGTHPLTHFAQMRIMGR